MFSIKTVICHSKRKGKKERKKKKKRPVQHEPMKKYFKRKYACKKQIQAKKA